MGDRPVLFPSSTEFSFVMIEKKKERKMLSLIWERCSRTLGGYFLKVISCIPEFIGWKPPPRHIAGRWEPVRPY